MPSTRNIVRVFLASPSDLPDERRAVHSAVTEFNRTLAELLDCQIELFGWEDTVSGFGRPQHIINYEVDRCDLFIGMIWKRWGTPPDADGAYSSGFEEEYQRSVDRHQRSGIPEISLFFKNIEDALTKDPGEQLQKVLAFRNSIMSQRSLLFESFDTYQEMEGLARRCLIHYVTRLTRKESTEASQTNTTIPGTEVEAARQEPNPTQVHPHALDALTFLEAVAGRIKEAGDLDDLSKLDVARLRLLSNSISKPGNQEMAMGSHDLNILFRASARGTVFGMREIYCLARMGLKYMRHENAPFWYWYARCRKLRPEADIALMSSAHGTTDDEQVSAIHVLESLGKELPDSDDFFTRDYIIKRWFSDRSSSRLKSAALRYLAKFGSSADYAHAEKEYANREPATSPAAIECMAGILLRHSPPNSAQRLILRTQFESLDRVTLERILTRFDSLQTEELLTGLQHRSTPVLLRTLEILLHRGEVSDQTLDQLSEHTDVSVRWRAVSALIERGRAYATEDVKRLLLKDQTYGTAAQSIVDRYVIDELKGLPESQLTSKIDNGLFFDDEPYFARAEKFFRKYGAELRSDVEDRFGRYFRERIERMERFFVNTMSTSVRGLIDRALESEDPHRQRLTRRGLDLLCNAKRPVDRDRIVKNLRDAYVGISTADAEYLESHGEWSDIPFVIQSATSSRSELWSWYESHDALDRAVAKAVVGMGRGRSATEFLLFEMPSSILAKVITLCSNSCFSTISPDAFMALLHDESDQVRRAAAIKAARTFPAKRIRWTLHQYIDSESFYYNVIHWLDLGASMSRNETRNVLRAAIE